MSRCLLAALPIKSAIPSLAFAVVAAALTVPCAVHAEDAEIASRRATDRTVFSNEEIKDGFFKTAFRAELQLDHASGRIRKFDEPIRIFVDDAGLPDRRDAIAAIVADIGAHVGHLDLAITEDRKAANFVVVLVPSKDFAQTLRDRYGENAAKRIQQKLRPECLSGIAKDGSFRIRRAEAILPTDVDDFRFYDCAYEEILQGMGLINDDASVPWTMFNDEVQMGFFDVYDQFLVNILYDPRIRPGMTRRDVEKVLPDVLLATRARVTGSASSGTVPIH
jgi:hypothetical protein